MKLEYKKLAKLIAGGEYYADAYFRIYPNFNGKKKDAASEVSKIKKKHPEFMEFVRNEQSRLIKKFGVDHDAAIDMLLKTLMRIINDPKSLDRDVINATERFSRILGIDKPTTLKIDQQVQHTHLLDTLEISNKKLPCIDITPRKIE